MAHPDDYDFLLGCGCKDASHILGFQTMPDGYSLMLDADGMYFFWIERATGRESVPTWDKWAVYRGAKADAAPRTAGEGEQ